MSSPFVWLGATPCDEACEPMGSRMNGSAVKARKECKAYLDQLLRTFGPPPEGASLRVYREPGGDGGYYEVCGFAEEGASEEALNWLVKVEGDTPREWDAIAAAQVAMF